MQRFFTSSRPQTAQAQHHVAKPVQDEDRGPQQPQEHAERPHHPKRRPFAALERQALGRQLAQHDMECRDDDEREGDGDGIGADADPCPHGMTQPRLDQVRQCRLTHPTESQRGDGDAELRRREVGIETTQCTIERLGIHAAGSDQLGHAATTDRDQRKLCGDKKPIGGDEEKNGDQAANIGHVFLRKRRRYRGLSPASVMRCMTRR